MTGSDKVFAGGIPAIYERFMVPMLFEPYAEDIAKRVAELKPGSVLETAAGTGAVTLALSRALPLDVKIFATDLNQPMLDEARSKLSNDGRVTWKQADALALPFDAESFDVIACQFGVMFFPDKVRAYAEARRLLKSSGSFVFNVWDEISNNDFVSVVNETLATLFPDDPPRFMERAPHGYHDSQLIDAQLRAAGFSEISVEAVEKRSRAESALAAATGYCQGNPLRNEIEARAPGQLAAVTSKVAEALAERFGAGQIDGGIRAYVITAS